MSLANGRTDLHALNNFPSSIDKVSFKKNSMSLGLVVLEEKLFTCMQTPQSDDISQMTDKSTDIKIQQAFSEKNWEKIHLMIFTT